MLTLLPFQEIGRDFLAHRKAALLADDMGLGKTVQAIEAAKLIPYQNGLILCPLNARRTWALTLRSQHPTAFVKELTTSKAVPDPTAYNVINYDIVWREPLLTQLKQFKWGVMIGDEAHFLKNHESKRTVKVLGRKGLYNHCVYRWMLTGTPVQNRPIELYPMLRSLAPEALSVYRDFYRFAFKFCSGFQGPFGFDATGSSNIPELANLLSSVMLRRMKEDVLPELPGVVFDKVYLDPTDKLMKLVTAESRAAAVNDGTVGSIRQGLGLLKIKPTVDHLKTILQEKDKVVVFTWHREVAHGIHDAFASSSVMFTGQQNANAKEESKRMFREDKRIKVFIGQITAAGSAIDGLQQVCDTCVFAELTYVPGQIMQCIDRLRRIGQDNSVQAQFLIAEDSEDEKLVNTLADKHKVIKRIQNEKGGQFALTKCRTCKKETELKKVKRAGILSVCPQCYKKLECLL